MGSRRDGQVLLLLGHAASTSMYALTPTSMLAKVPEVVTPAHPEAECYPWLQRASEAVTPTHPEAECLLMVAKSVQIFFG